jgi:hypothetical protein
VKQDQLHQSTGARRSPGPGRSPRRPQRPVGGITRSGLHPRTPAAPVRGPAADPPWIATPALTGIWDDERQCQPADVSPAMPVTGYHIAPRRPGTMPGYAGHPGTAPSVLAPHAHLHVSRDRPWQTIGDHLVAIRTYRRLRAHKNWVDGGRPRAQIDQICMSDSVLCPGRWPCPTAIINGQVFAATDGPDYVIAPTRRP